jgi:hemolysin activation/secretion protein
MHCLTKTAAVLWLAAVPSLVVAEENAEPSRENPPSQNAAFDVWEYRVLGNSVLDNKTIEDTLYPFLGLGLTIDTVEGARKALEKAFHGAGYKTVLVEIPEQEVNEGIVRLQVVEGKVAKLAVTGSQYFSLGHIRSQVPSLAEGQVPNMPKLQKELTALNAETPDRKVTPVLRAGNTPGTLEVDLQVDDQLPLHGSVEVNGRNNANTSRSRVIASLRYDNLWQRFHSASLQFQTTPEDPNQVQVWSGTYTLPTHWWDTRLVMYGIGIDSTTQIAGVGAMSVVGSGDIYGLRLLKPLEGTDSFFHNLSLGVEYKSFGQAVTLLGSDTQNTPISYAPFSARYDATMLHGEDARTSLDIALNFSLRGVGNNAQEFDDKRLGARSNYAYVEGELKHLHTLPWDFKLSTRLSGQIADGLLISNEQFSAGGVGSVRGYHQTQQLGDDGVAFSTELYTPSLRDPDWEWMQQWRFLAFAEGAQLWVHKPLKGTPSAYSLASFGAGMRMQLFKHLSSEFDWSYPLLRSDTIDVGQQRIDFSLVYDF